MWIDILYGHWLTQQSIEVSNATRGVGRPCKIFCLYGLPTPGLFFWGKIECWCWCNWMIEGANLIIFIGDIIKCGHSKSCTNLPSVHTWRSGGSNSTTLEAVSVTHYHHQGFKLQVSKIDLFSFRALLEADLLEWVSHVFILHQKEQVLTMGSSLGSSLSICSFYVDKLLKLPFCCFCFLTFWEAAITGIQLAFLKFARAAPSKSSFKWNGFPQTLKNPNMVINWTKNTIQIQTNRIDTCVASCGCKQCSMCSVGT